MITSWAKNLLNIYCDMLPYVIVPSYNTSIAASGLWHLYCFFIDIDRLSSLLVLAWDSLLQRLPMELSARENWLQSWGKPDFDSWDRTLKMKSLVQLFLLLVVSCAFRSVLCGIKNAELRSEYAYFLIGNAPGIAYAWWFALSNLYYSK